MTKVTSELSDLYSEQWRIAVANCHKSLVEKDDLKKVQRVQDAEAVRILVRQLHTESIDRVTTQELSMLPLHIAHLEELAALFEASLDHKVSSAALWGTLYMVIKISSTSDMAFHRSSRMLKILGRKAELFNSFSKRSPDLKELKEGALEIQLEMLEFFTYLVNYFRTEAFEHEDVSWQPAIQMYQACVRHVDEAFERIERLAQLIRSDSRMDEVTRLQSLLSLTQEGFRDEVKLPCAILPTMKNFNVYDREDILVKTDEYYRSMKMAGHKPWAIAFHGLGGVGKSQTALKYSQRKIQERTLDAVLWVHSETATALAQSFTYLAQRLELSGTHEHHHEKNKVLVLDWLQRTRARWLLIFDNAENAEQLLEYWPVASEGSVLLTTRNRSLAFHPAGIGIEIPPFEQDRGSEFLLHLLSMDVASDITTQEVESAMELSQRLSGHALAISQMAGIIHRRGWSIAEFLQIYQRNAQKLDHKTSLDTVWKLSFESLDSNALALLGVLSFLMPASIPRSLFQPDDSDLLPKDLSFCDDELDYADTVGTLLDLALLKRDKDTKSLSLHRLVQSQFRYHLSADKHQDAFDNASQLLDVAFPRRPRQSHQMHLVWKTCALYLQHVLALMNIYDQDVRLKPSQHFCQLLIKCARYLCENGSYGELEKMLGVAQKAINHWGQGAQNPQMVIELAFHTSVQWQQRANFPLSDFHITEAITLHHQSFEPDPYLSLTLYNHKSNVQACLNRHDEAYEWQHRIEQLHKLPGAENVRPTTLTMRNLARCLWKINKPEEALAKWDLVIRESKEASANWANLAHSFFGSGNVYRSLLRFDEANAFFWKAQNCWVKNGSPTHEFVGVCYYKLGCVALDRNRCEEAIDHLRHALTIAELQSKYSPGHVARTKYKLGHALRRLSEYQMEADEEALEAERIYHQIVDNSTSTVPPAGEIAYDNLIANFWR